MAELFCKLPLWRLEGIDEMPFVTVSSGGASDVEEGVYEVVLIEISEPKTVTAQRGPKAGQEIQLLDWTFAILAGAHQDKQLVASTSVASGPKSKMYAYLTALLGGRPPAIGQAFEKKDLIGRMALATVAIDEAGWPRVANLGAVPASMLSAHLAKATGAPTTEAVPQRSSRAPLNLQPAGATTAVAEKGDDLPF